MITLDGVILGCMVLGPLYAGIAFTVFRGSAAPSRARKH